MDPYELELGIAEMGIGSRKKKWVSENHGGEMCEWEWRSPPRKLEIGVKKNPEGIEHIVRESCFPIYVAQFQGMGCLRHRQSQ